MAHRGALSDLQFFGSLQGPAKTRTMDMGPVRCMVWLFTLKFQLIPNYTAQ